MIHGKQLSLLLDDDETRAPLNDIGLVPYFALLDNALSGLHKPALGHIQKNSAGLIFRKKSQEFLIGRRIPFLILDFLVKIA
jgi:hypothetical protein